MKSYAALLLLLVCSLHGCTCLTMDDDIADELGLELLGSRKGASKYLAAGLTEFPDSLSLELMQLRGLLDEGNNAESGDNSE